MVTCETFQGQGLCHCGDMKLPGKKIWRTLRNFIMCKLRSAWWRHLPALEKLDAKKVVLAFSNFIFRF